MEDNKEKSSVADAEFNKQLFKNNLKKGNIESTMDFESFLKKNIYINPLP